MSNIWALAHGRDLAAALHDLGQQYACLEDLSLPALAYNPKGELMSFFPFIVDNYEIKMDLRFDEASASQVLAMAARKDRNTLAMLKRSATTVDLVLVLLARPIKATFPVEVVSGEQGNGGSPRYLRVLAVH